MGSRGRVRNYDPQGGSEYLPSVVGVRKGVGAAELVSEARVIRSVPLSSTFSPVLTFSMRAPSLKTRASAFAGTVKETCWVAPGVAKLSGSSGTEREVPPPEIRKGEVGAETERGRFVSDP